jgi:hypothetical protein
VETNTTDTVPLTATHHAPEILLRFAAARGKLLSTQVSVLLDVKLNSIITNAEPSANVSFYLYLSALLMEDAWRSA